MKSPAPYGRACTRFFGESGRLAQLGEHNVRNVGVVGSNPMPSTKETAPIPHPHSVQLRPISIDDAQAITRLLAGDTELALQTATIPIPYTIHDARAFLQRADPLQNFAIIAGEELVGGCGFKQEPGDIEIGYWVGRPYWGRGYASAAAQLLIEEARRRGVERLYAEVFLENPASMRVLEKAGFVPEGEVERVILQRGGRRRIVRFHREL